MRKGLRVAGLSLLALLGLSLAAFTSAVLWPTPQLAPPPVERSLAIVGVGLVDAGADRVHPNQTVLIAGGRIAAVGSVASTAVPAGAHRIDGRGRYLMPALTDMHSHVYAFAPLLDLPLYIAYGVTNVRDMQGCPTPDDPFIACAADKKRWSREAMAGERIGPRVLASTSFMADGPRNLDRVKSAPPYFGTRTPDEARRFVRHFAGEVEAIKVYDNIPRDAYFALAAEAKRLGLDVVGHRPRAVSAVEAAAHQKSIEHARFLLHESFSGSADLRARAGTPGWREDRAHILAKHDPAAVQAIFAAMRENGTWYVPTHLSRWSDAYADRAEVSDDPLLRFIHPLVERQWREDVDELLADDPSPEARADYRRFYDKGLELTGAAHRAGVGILAGTDYLVSGPDLHRELRQLVAGGLSPAEAIRAATLSPAQYFGLERQLGTIAPGKVADLVLLNADPLADIGNSSRIEAVIHGGRVYDRAMLNRIKRHVEGQARSWTVGAKILWRFLLNPGGY